MLIKEEYIDIIENLDFFYGYNLISTALLRKEKSKELQEKDLENFKQKINFLKQLINEHFDNQFLDAEVELLISLLRRVEDELGMDITLLIDKLRRIQNTLPKEEGVVTCVEFEID